MGDTASEIRNDSLTLEGLEQVFEVEPVTRTGGTGAAPVTDAMELVTGAEGVPVEQAAQIIGTSVNALKKRLRKGTLRGTKIGAKHGEKWFVHSSELTEFAIKEQVTGAGPVTALEVQVTGAIAPVPTSATDKAGKDLINRIQDLEKKLEGATYRNGYLEAENEGLKLLLGAKDSQIKLLTDSQHTRGKWPRFWSWFTGRS